MLLKRGSTVDDLRKAYSRLEVTRALGAARARILREGLCGVVPRTDLASAFCVGSWCHPRGDAAIWGLGPNGTVAATVGTESDGPTIASL